MRGPWNVGRGEVFAHMRARARVRLDEGVVTRWDQFAVRWLRAPRSARIAQVVAFIAWGERSDGSRIAMDPLPRGETDIVTRDERVRFPLSSRAGVLVWTLDALPPERGRPADVGAAYATDDSNESWDRDDDDTLLFIDGPNLFFGRDASHYARHHPDLVDQPITSILIEGRFHTFLVVGRDVVGVVEWDMRFRGDVGVLHTASSYADARFRPEPWPPGLSEPALFALIRDWQGRERRRPRLERAR